VVTDLNMPDMNSLELMQKLHEHDRDLPVIVATALADLGSAVTAMRAGADDFISKPVELDQLTLVLERALQRRAVKNEAEFLRRQMRERDGEGLRGMIGASSAMQKIYTLARQVAGSRATVLITGESGTGKGELARAIHALGPRASKPFVALHCAAGEIPLLMQVKLLRVLQERTFERIGGNGSIHCDVRVIAATNRGGDALVLANHLRTIQYRLHQYGRARPPTPGPDLARHQPRTRGAGDARLASHGTRAEPRATPRRRSSSA
jgi:two-component system response regulator HydG